MPYVPRHKVPRNPKTLFPVPQIVGLQSCYSVHTLFEDCFAILMTFRRQNWMSNNGGILVECLLLRLLFGTFVVFG